MTRTVIAIDGGNSKTDAVLVTEHGEVLARARSGPFIPHIVGAVDAVASLTTAIESLLAQARRPRVDLIAAYLANADLPIEEQRLYDAFISYDWAHRVVVENDTLALLRTGTSEAHGVAVVCGAGINAVGVGLDGSRVRFPALGRITGDWGGGLGLAKQALWSTSRFLDGRGPATSLATLVAEHFGYASAVDVSIAMHLSELDYDRMHEIVPLLLDAAADGDPVAAGIVERQAREIVLLVETTLRRLDMKTSVTEVVLGGGILGSGRPVLLDPVRAGISEAAPHATIVLAHDSPIAGAALLALELLWESKAPDDALSSARRSLTTPSLETTS